MARALYVRESIVLTESTEQKLLAFARKRGLRSGDTLVVAAYRLSAGPDYVLDLRDPADPALQLGLTVLADVVDAPGLIVDVSGDAASTSGATPGAGRTATVFARSLTHPVTVRASGGAGARGADGAAGDDEIRTDDVDARGKPVVTFDPPTPGGPGSAGGPGGPGGSATVHWVEGATASAVAAGGMGGAGGTGGMGGQGAIGRDGRRRNGAADGLSGGAGPTGLAGSAASGVLEPTAFWAVVRSTLGADLDAAAAHWLGTAEYRYRQVRGTPTPDEAGSVLGQLDLVGAATGGDPAAERLRAQFRNGDTVLGLPRNLDVLPDFDRMQAALDSYRTWVDPLFEDAKDLVRSASAASFGEARLAVELRALESSRRTLGSSVLAADADVAAAQRELDGIRALWSAAAAEAERRRNDLQAPIDWGGIVVVGLFKVVGFVLSLYEPAAGKLVSSVPDYMVLGNTSVGVSGAEISVLTAAVGSGGKAVTGLKGLVTSSGDVSWASVADDAGHAVISFATFVRDLDSASGDATLKALVKELAQRLQEVLVARERFASASRQAAIARQRQQAAVADEARYAVLYERARGDTSVQRETAQSLLRIVRRFGDVMLREKLAAARAVEIYRLTDESAAMAMDRWHVHPDVEADYADGFVDDAAYASRLSLSEADLTPTQLKADFDAGRTPTVQEATHYVTINDPGVLAQFRQQLSATFEVRPEDLVGDRFRATVTKAALALDGVHAATPSFSVGLTHGGRCSYLLEDGSALTQVLEPRLELVEVATTGATGTAVGAAAVDDDRVQHFWRRAVATQWRVSIEPAVVTEAMVDLSGLSAIRVALRYEAVVKP